MQYLCDVSAVLQQRSLASGALGSLRSLNPEKHCAQGDALLVQYLCDVSAVLQQRSLASGALGSLKP